jgi:hypothetical protein
MSAVKLIAVFSQNKPGEATRITGILADSRVSIRWVTIADTGSFGVVKLLVDKCEPAMEALKQKGIAVNYIEAIAVEVPDKCGALHAVVDCLARHNINLENSSGFVANHRAVLVLEAKDPAAARAVLQKNGHKLLSQEEILDL